MTRPAVTIAMPVYNGVETLAATIESLSAQTADGITILVSNDASTDDTPGLLDGWAKRDPRVKVVHHARNLGPIRNYSFAGRRAATPLVMFAAQDDVWSPNYVEALRASLEVSPDAPLAFARNILMSAGLQSQTKVIPAVPPKASLRARRVQFMLRHARSGWFYGLYRKDVLLADDLADRYDNPWGHDFVTLLPALLGGAAATADDAVFYQRITTMSHSRWYPRTPHSRYALHLNMRKAALAALAASPLTTAEKAYVLPFLHKYTGRHTFKLGGIARQFAAEKLGSSRP